MCIKNQVPEENKQIGIMGGAFNPFHNGHLRHAIEVCERMSLSHVELLPSAHHPHKKGLLPFDLRCECIEKAIENVPFLSLNPLENFVSAPSYTDKILRVWKEKNPTHTPFFLMGTEDFATLPSWNNGFSLPKLAHLLLVSRHSHDANFCCYHALKFWEPEGRKVFFFNDNDKIICDETSEKNQSIHEKNALIADQGITSKSLVEHGYSIYDQGTIIPKTKKLHIAIEELGFMTYLDIPHLDITATFIRNLWIKKQNISGLIHHNTLKTLEENQETLKAYWKE